MPRLSFALFGAAALSFGFAGVAGAADMQIKAPAYVAPAAVPGWTGFYVGGDLGALWMSQDAVWNPLPSPATLRMRRRRWQRPPRFQAWRHHPADHAG